MYKLWMIKFIKKISIIYYVLALWVLLCLKSLNNTYLKANDGLFWVVSLPHQYTNAQ